MSKITLVEAVTAALEDAMHADENVVLLGEDIGKNGGVFRATEGLYQTFGPKRVIDTPLAENLIAGLAVGMATQQLKPVAELQFMGFSYAAMDQLFSHAARFRNRTCGRLTCPLVVRAPYGGGIHAPEHHSESFEAMFAQVPGLKVVIPSSPQKAYGLLLSAIDDPDPVCFFEPKRIYRAQQQTVPRDQQRLPLGQAWVERWGTDITMVAWGAMLPVALQSAQVLSDMGIDAEVIDVATIKPLDMATILSSVAKTKRLLVVQESAPYHSVASEILAQVSQQGFFDCIAPLQCVSGYDTVMPLYQNEQHYLPTVTRVVQSACQAMEFA